MYEKTVTIFNFHETASGTACWYPHVIPNVDLNIDRGAIIKKYGPNCTDNAELHIAYESDQIYITDQSDRKLPWMPPKAWKNQEEGKQAESITFGLNDFFMLGEWPEETINEDDYPNGFYQYMNSQNDFVFKITMVGGPYVVIPHFEITGK